MNLQSLLAGFQSLVQSFPPLPAFLYGVFVGVFFGLVLASLVMGRHSLGSFLRRSLLGAVALAPAVLACLLWGAWFGILAAKDIVH